MKILVTGSGGFIGREITRRLLAEGHELLGISRSNNSVSGVKNIAMDLNSPDLAKTIEQIGGIPDVIVHAAAYVGNEPAEQLITDNCLATYRLLQLSRKWECKKFVYLSSLPLIGDPGQFGQKEDMPVRPPTLYHATKHFGEVLLEVDEFIDIESTALRIPSPIGIEMNPKTIFSVFVKNAITHQTLTLRGKGSRVQNFLHVTDIAFCVSNSLKYTVRGIFHIGGTSVSNLVLAQKCIALTNSHSKILFEGIDSEDGVEWKPICNKAQEELHFIPTISLDDAIKEYAEHCVSL